MAGPNMLSVRARRERFRNILERDEVTRPASIFDPVSARLAEAAGFELGIFPGSVASHTILGAPDIVLVTLDELAEQTRRISRASSISFFVDGDHGFGNALNVMRTIEALEFAGASAVTIEDSDLPPAAGKSDRALISMEEFEGKLKAAVAARGDMSFVIIGRTSALRVGGLPETLPRIEACNRAGVDAIFVGGGTADERRAVGAVTSLPLILDGPLDPTLKNDTRVRIAEWNNLPFRTALKSLSDAYVHLAAGRPGNDLRASTSTEVDDAALAEAAYKSFAESYLA